MSRPAQGRAKESETQAKTWLLPEQVDELREAALSSEVPTYLQDRDLALVSLLYDLGLRRSEAAGLDVDYLDLDAGTVYLPSEIQKGGDVPDATLEFGLWGADATLDVRRYLRDRWKESPAMFPSRQSPRMTGKSVNNRVKKLAAVAGVEPQLKGGGTGEPSDVTSHTLRHSVAYRIIQVEGGRLEDVQMRLRHASRQVTDRIYSHLIPR